MKTDTQVAIESRIRDAIRIEAHRLARHAGLDTGAVMAMASLQDDADMEQCRVAVVYVLHDAERAMPSTVNAQEASPLVRARAVLERLLDAAATARGRCRHLGDGHSEPTDEDIAHTASALASAAALMASA